MHPHLPPHIHRDQQPDLEGSIRRHAFKVDKVTDKSYVRSGEKNICSRFYPGRIYGLVGRGSSSTIGGTSSTIYGSSLTSGGRSAHGRGDASNNDNGFVNGSSLTTGHQVNGRGYTSNKDYGLVDGVIDGTAGQVFVIDNDNGFIDSNNAVTALQKIAANTDCGFISMLKEDDPFEPIDSEEYDDGSSRGKQPSLIWDDKAGYGNRGDQVKEPQSVKLARRLAAKAGELYTTIAAEIESVNTLLGNMNKSDSIIPATSTTRLHSVLTNHVNVLLNGILSREDALIQLQERLSIGETELERVKEELHNAQMDYENVDDQLRDAKAEIVQLKQKSAGLDASIRDELDNLGFSDVQELIDSYVQLQDRVEVIEKNFSSKSVCSGFLRAPSRVSIATARCKVVQPLEQKVKQNSGGSVPLNNNHSSIPSTRVQLPMPDKFKGKTRAELERFFSLYEAGTNSKGWSDKDRGVYLGSYLPKMQLYHDSLMQRGATYQQMKQELLNALGSDGAVATYYLRSQLDRLTKPSSKSYKQLFEEVELQVIEAFGGDTVSREDELKKILLRITDEDSDATFSTIVMTNVTSSYYKLKELVLALEASIFLKKKNVKPEAKRKDSPNKAYNGVKHSDHSRRGNHPDFQGENFRTGRQEDYQDFQGEDCRTGRQDYYKDFQDEDCRSVGDEDQDTQHNQKCSDSEGYSQRHVRCYNCQKVGHFARDCPEEGNAHNVNLQSTKLLVPSVNLVGTLGTVQQVIQNSSKGDYGRKKQEQASRQSKVEKVSVKKKKFELRDKKDSQQTHFSRGHTVKVSKNGIEAKADKSREGDTVVIGGTNAFKFARLIGVKHWSSRTLNDKTLHSKVAAENVKRLIYFPSGNLFFRRAMEFDAARAIFLKSLKQLSKLGAVEVMY